MRLLIAVLLLLTIPTFASKKLVHDHTAKAVYHHLKLKYQLEDYPVDKLYHSGDYICTEGTEHVAPDCRKLKDWYVVTQRPYAEITFDDGRTGIIPFDRPTPGEIMLGDGTDITQLYSDEHIKAVADESLHGGPRPCLNVRGVTLDDNPINFIFRRAWNGEKKPDDGSEMTFHYAITKNKLGDEEIKILEQLDLLVFVGENNSVAYNRQVAENEKRNSSKAQT